MNASYRVILGGWRFFMVRENRNRKRQLKDEKTEKRERTRQTQRRICYEN